MSPVRTRMRNFLRRLPWLSTRIAPTSYYAGDWDKEYATGNFKRLENLAEIGHYGVILNYARVLEPRSILDVGCGNGILSPLLNHLPYESYLGIDLSAEAIRMATEDHGDARTTFAVADAESFLSDQSFDLIIFNECLYYLKDPRGLMLSYKRWLRPGGHILVSMYISPPNREIWRKLEGDFALKDSMVAWNLRITGGWSVGLLVPADAPGAHDGELDMAMAGSRPNLE
jgi:SAM-dependent methyltransferase